MRREGSSLRAREDPGFVGPEIYMVLEAFLEQEYKIINIKLGRGA